MEKTAVNTDKMAPPVGPYSHAVKVKGGSLLFVSGCVGIDREGKVPIGYEAQCRLAYENLRAVLEAAGTSFDNLLKLTNYIKEGYVGHYPVMAKIRKEYIRDKSRYPASTLVEVKGLLYPELLLEIEAVAVVEDGSPSESGAQPPRQQKRGKR